MERKWLKILFLNIKQEKDILNFSKKLDFKSDIEVKSKERSNRERGRKSSLNR